MQLSHFHYDLPDELIARFPTQKRTQSRLLACLKEGVRHSDFSDLLDLLNPNDCLIMNNTKVIPARLYGKKPTGGEVECLIERIISADRALCHVRASKSLKPGSSIVFNPQASAFFVAKHESLYELRLDSGTWWDLAQAQGEMPLPPYLERSAEELDVDRYQTVYASEPGAVAAPTAGLHFDQPLLDAIQAKGVRIQEVTLHVGAGTFQPVRTENIHEHRMHKEWLSVSQAVCDCVNETRNRGGRVIAVGTTSVRSLESASQSGTLAPFEGETDIFITPGYSFKSVDAMITNFHLPCSTLIMLVSAFAGHERIMSIYQEAIDRSYRFFSYGDAMFLTPKE